MRGRWTSLLLLTAGLLAAGCRTRGMCPMAPEETSGRGEAWNALHEFASGDPDAIPAAVLVLTREVPIARYKPLFMTLCEGPDPLSSPDGGERVKSLRDLLSRDDAEGRRQGVLRVLWYASDDWVSLTPDLGPTDAQSPYGEAVAALVGAVRAGRAPGPREAAGGGLAGLFFSYFGGFVWAVMGGRLGGWRWGWASGCRSSTGL